MRRSSVVALCVLWMWGLGASAQVRVVKGAGAKSSMSIAGFTADASAGAQLFLKTLQADLNRSGYLSLSGAAGAEFALMGSCEESASSLTAKCDVYATANRKNYLSQSFRAQSSGARRLAHEVSDAIIEALTGQKGMASAKLVMVGRRTGQKELYVCDADGQNLVQLTHDKNISLAPKWGPDGQSIVYTSYLQKFPDVYLIDVASGNRRKLAGYPGLNTGGAVSPNGRDIALILSKDGNPDLYIKRMDGDEPVRVTATPRLAEASPSWSPDGSQIVFVSDRSGTPQLYVVSRNGGKAVPITSRGLENVAPDWGPNGLITYASRVGGRYQVCVLDPKTLNGRQVTMDGADYEDPSWAPDGRHIACSRTQGYRSQIYLLDTLGDAPIGLVAISGDWYSPSWSPR